jgi:nitroreductase
MTLACDATPTPGDQALPAAAIDAVSHCVTTLRSIRRFLPDDVDPSLIDFALTHAVQAGSAKNRQPWRFVVVRDSGVRRDLGAWYRRAWSQHQRSAVASAGGERQPQEAEGPHTPEGKGQLEAAAPMAQRFEEAPVVVVACFEPTRRNAADFFGGASIYPAVQNFLLACRMVGLGATLTTLQARSSTPCDPAAVGGSSFYDQLREIVGVPEHAVPAALLPVGWPAARFGTGRRRPVDEVAFLDKWGETWPYSHGADEPEGGDERSGAQTDPHGEECEGPATCEEHRGNRREDPRGNRREDPRRDRRAS